MRTTVILLVLGAATVAAQRDTSCDDTIDVSPACSFVLPDSTNDMYFCGKDGLILALQNGCYNCVDVNTCEQPVFVYDIDVPTPNKDAEAEPVSDSFSSQEIEQVVEEANLLSLQEQDQILQEEEQFEKQMELSLESPTNGLNEFVGVAADGEDSSTSNDNGGISERPYIIEERVDYFFPNASYYDSMLENEQEVQEVIPEESIPTEIVTPASIMPVADVRSGVLRVEPKSEKAFSVQQSALMQAVNEPGLENSDFSKKANDFSAWYLLAPAFLVGIAMYTTLRSHDFGNVSFERVNEDEEEEINPFCDSICNPQNDDDVDLEDGAESSEEDDDEIFGEGTFQNEEETSESETHGVLTRL
jgi:hypothetical protein